MTKKWILIIFLLITFTGFGQVKTFTEKDYAEKAHWIQFMDLESVNFNEALKAYDIYWQNHKQPEEEGDRIAESRKRIKPLSKKEIRVIREGDEMRFQIKRFKHWKIINEAFVKENGFTMTAEEKLRFHNQHQ